MCFGGARKRLVCLESTNAQPCRKVHHTAKISSPSGRGECQINQRYPTLQIRSIFFSRHIGIFEMRMLSVVRVLLDAIGLDSFVESGAPRYGFLFALFFLFLFLGELSLPFLKRVS